MCTVDLRDAYLHVPIHPGDRRFFGFEWEGRRYVWCALPFGFRDSPRLFQKLMVAALTPLRGKGLRFVIYLDDFLILAQSREQCLRDTALLLQHLTSLGFLISDKSQLTPSQSRCFLGVVVDSVRLEFQATQEKLRRAAAFCQATLGLQEVEVGRLRKLLGVLQSLSDCIAPARVHLNYLFLMLKSALVSGAQSVRLSEGARQDLTFWASHLDQWNGRALFRPDWDLEIATDASDSGWGAVARAKDGRILLSSRGFFEESLARAHINVKELWAVKVAACALLRDLDRAHKLEQVRCVRFLVDNTTALSYINRGGGRHQSLFSLAADLHQVLEARGLVYFASWVASEENVLPDRLSRVQNDFSDKRLSPVVFREIVRLFGPLRVDCFATRVNAQLPLFVSYRPDPEAMYTDIFSRPLPEGPLYANPPFAVISRWLRVLRDQQREAVCIIPVWPSRPWWPVLQDMVVGVPRLLPRLPDLFRAPPSALPQTRIATPRWQVMVCTLSGVPSARAVWMQQLLGRWHVAGRQVRTQAAVLCQTMQESGASGLPSHVVEDFLYTVFPQLA